MSDFCQPKGYLKVKCVFSEDFAKSPFSVSSVLTSPADLPSNALKQGLSWVFILERASGTGGNWSIDQPKAHPPFGILWVIG